jgi:ribonuclease G
MYMNAELLINVTPQETRLAVIDNGAVQEIMIERSNHRGLVGNIYKGRVNRVLPGMQAAFIDVGLERTAFLHASDIAPSVLEESQTEQTGRYRREDNNADSSQDSRASEITQLLHDGKEILVQVIKDPIGSKGARLTTHLSIPACYLVLMPGEDSIGVSQKIEDDDERLRLRNICR